MYSWCVCVLLQTFLRGNDLVSAKSYETLNNRFLLICTGFPIPDFIESLPHFCGKQIVQREKKLSCLQASALKEYLSK